MAEDLIQTKISVPPARMQHVHRDRLYRRLDAGAQHKLTLITAPAGFGKSTLLSSWAGQQDTPLAWFSLDGQDNDTDRFLDYLLAALQSAAPRLQLLEGTAALRQVLQPEAHQALLTFLVNRAHRSGESLSVVLDDYHVIDNPAVHDMVAFLLEHMPPDFHILVASRNEPGFPLAKLRAAGQMLEITAEDLRFTVEEAAQFLQAGMGLRISPQDVAALEARTEGWIAGLQLAALSLEGREDAGVLIASLRGTDRYILDYLAEEVFSRLPDLLQVFLLRISVVDRFSQELCDALVGDGLDEMRARGQVPGEQLPAMRSRDILEFLDSSNLFVFPLDHERRWYRFHQLFADFLLDRLGATHPKEIPELHRRASAWFSSKGLTHEAIRHALLAEEPALAAALIEGQARLMLAQGQTGQLSRWIESLPEDMLSSKPALVLALTWAKLLADPVQHQPFLQDIVSRLSDRLGVDRITIVPRLSERDLPAPERDLLGQYALLLAFMGRDQLPYEETVSLFQAALASLPAQDLFMRAFALGGLASTYARQGKLSLAERTFALAAETSRQHESPYAYLVAKDWEATSQAAQGHLTRAASTYRGVIDRLSDLAADQLPLTGHAFVGLADILREQNDLSAALELVNEGLRRGRLIMDRDALREGYVVQARILTAMGEKAGARAALDAGLQEARNTGSQTCLDEALAWEVMLSLAWGDAAPAMRWASDRDLLNPKDAGRAEMLAPVERLALARLQVAQGNLVQATVVLTHLLRALEDGEQGHLALGVGCALSTVLQASGEREGAMRTLGRALLRGEAEGFLRSFLDEGPRMAALLRRAASEGHSPAYAERILGAFGQDLSSEVAVEPLSERELEVLRLMGEGLSNTQIAAKLVVAESTVKTHINHIYGKLGVTRRTHAVAKARELRLLD